MPKKSFNNAGTPRNLRPWINLSATSILAICFVIYIVSLTPPSNMYLTFLFLALAAVLLASAGLVTEWHNETNWTNILGLAAFTALIAVSVAMGVSWLLSTGAS